jgi:hypothetical protein
MAVIDPAAAQVMQLASQVLAAEDKIRRQQATIWGLVAALRAEQCASGALAELLDAVLAGDG